MAELRHSQQEQARLDADAEQRFGLPPGTLSQFDTGNTAQAYARLQRMLQSGVSRESIDAALEATGRHPIAGSVTSLRRPGGQVIEYGLGDYARMAAVAAAPLTAGLAYGALAGGGAGGASGAGGGAAGGAGGAGGFFGSNTGKLLQAGASLLGGHVAGRQAQQAAQERAGGATLQELLPTMMQLLQQQQAQSGQNFALQTQRYQANLPMQDALRNMAMNMLPRQYTQGLQLGTPLSQQPLPPLAPTMPAPRREED
jgi:hypothetical protein